MKHRLKCVCGAELKVESAGNEDMGKWEKDTKGRWRKIKRPSRYVVVFLCKRGTCKKGIKITGRNKADVHARINQEFRKQQQRPQQEKEVA